MSVALVATAYAHRIPNASDIAIEAYVLAGGDIANICGDPGSDNTVAHPDCPACRIAGSVLLPDAPQSMTDIDFVFVATVVAPRERRAILTVLDPARGMRAPPLA
ncbi:hypothetical protein [Pukyongiella litopenaei]|uniref:hypothetical protein n=1 Tax=Pukyongiella litopenaei TaxID=2605946 RepID=UPI000D0AF7FF|nr:hypothetical protein [Pukyongiella litopenaei]